MPESRTSIRGTIGTGNEGECCDSGQKGGRSIRLPDLGALPSAELVALLSDKNQWVRRTVQRLLAERDDPEILDALIGVLSEGGEQEALEALWAIHGIGRFDDSLAIKSFGHSNPHIRSWAARLVGDPRKTLMPEVIGKLLELARDEKHAVVISQLAATAARIPSPQAVPLVRQLLERREFADRRIHSSADLVGAGGAN